MIFGGDDRKLIQYNNQNGRFVRIESTFSDGSILQGSGVIIGINDVLTAAHVIYSTDLNEAAVSTVITPAQFNDYTPFGTVDVNHYYLTQEWVDNASFSYDYAVLSLDTEIGYYTGIAHYGYITDPTTTASDLMTSYGYASDINDGKWLVKTTGYPDYLQNSNVLLFDDDLDLATGQSGSAVLIDNETYGDIVIGLVSHHSYFPEYNGVFTLTQSAVENINEWITLNDDNIFTPLSTQYSFNSVKQISHLYTALLGRVSEEDGIKNWVNHLESDMTFLNVIDGFLNSTELLNGEDYTGDNQSFINSLYINILGRKADQNGYDYWLSELAIHNSKAQIVNGFLDSNEYADIQSLTTYTVWHNYFQSFNREVTGTNNSEIIETTNLDDYINSLAGDDEIIAGTGNDYIVSGSGNDTITGGEGSDFFVFDLSEDGIDIVTDFDIQTDRLKITGYTNIQIANTDDEEQSLVIYEDENSYVILTGILKEQFNDIVFV